VYGPAACVLAKLPIKKGEELYVNYNYRLTWAPAWYKEAYAAYQEAKELKEGSQQASRWNTKSFQNIYIYVCMKAKRLRGGSGISYLV
jgi:hypothetical protein